MATEEEAAEALYGAIVRAADRSDPASLVLLAEAFSKLTPPAEDDKPEPPVLLSGADMLHVDPDQWYGDRVGFTNPNLPRSPGVRPTHQHPEVFT